MTSEASLQQQIRLEAANAGVRLWRNNSGACYDETGRLIRYGLGNDSAQLNKRLKSGDLVGITPVVVTQDMVGKVVGIFTNIEVKAPGWKQPSNEQERAQLAFIDLVRQCGAIAGFANSIETFKRIIGR